MLQTTSTGFQFDKGYLKMGSHSVVYSFLEQNGCWFFFKLAMKPDKPKKNNGTSLRLWPTTWCRAEPELRWRVSGGAWTAGISGHVHLNSGIVSKDSYTTAAAWILLPQIGYFSSFSQLRSLFSELLLRFQHGLATWLWALDFSTSFGRCLDERPGDIVVTMIATGSNHRTSGHVLVCMKDYEGVYQSNTCACQAKAFKRLVICVHWSNNCPEIKEFPGVSAEPWALWVPAPNLKAARPFD